jgi:hypothetical protein
MKINKVSLLILGVAFIFLAFYFLRVMCRLPVGLEEVTLRGKIRNAVNVIAENLNEQNRARETIHVYTNDGSDSMPCRCMNPLTVYVYGFSRDYERQQAVMDRLSRDGGGKGVFIDVVFYGYIDGERNQGVDGYVKFDRQKFESSGRKFRQVKIQVATEL